MTIVESLSIPQLAEQCQAETQRYRQTQQSNLLACFELFRRALAQQSEAAWSAIEAQYRVLVLRWVYTYTAQIDEAPEVFVNEAFARMWQYGSKPETTAKLTTLSKCLSYLKKCVWSAIEDYRSRQRHQELVIEWQHVERMAPKLNNPEGQLIETDLRRTVRRVLAQTVQNEQERIVAEETWLYDRKPRQIQADHAEIFASVQEVSQTKRNILNRLKRNQALLRLLS